MDKILLIVDPQVDFISGSLAVDGAKEKMDALVTALRSGELSQDYVAVTKDAHPSTHCSFVTNGGQWPIHCRVGTEGFELYPPLQKWWDELDDDKGDLFYKGMEPDHEEYSIFENKRYGTVRVDILLDFELDDTNEIRVVGIAGDYCVYDTIWDLIEMGLGDRIVVDTRFIASIDGGEKLKLLISNNNLKWV